MSYAYPSQYGPPSAPPERPGTITAAALITIVLASLLTMVAGIALVLGLIASIAAGSLSSEARDLPGFDALLAFGVSALLVFCLALLALGVSLIVFSAKAMRGRNWARIVITVFLALGTLSGLSNLAQDGTGGNMVGLASMVLALVFFWLPSANRWYAAQAAHSAGTTAPPYPGAPPSSPPSSLGNR